MANEWGYTLENGPHTWPKNFQEACGDRQSPIDIRTNEVTLDPKLSSNLLRWTYPNKTLNVTNSGYGWKAHVQGEGSVLEGGPLKDKYQLEQFHCHWGENDLVGSEHLVDGQSYAAEMHFVHWNTKYGSFSEALKHGDGLAVLGVFLQVGKENSELNYLTKVIPDIKFKNQKVDFDDSLDPSKLFPDNHAYWTYLGSLTTPPCTECVIWIVFKDPIEISHGQLEVFRSLSSADEESSIGSDKEDPIMNNYRPVLPRGDRSVKASYI